MKLSRALSYDKNSSVAALRPPAALLHNAGRFASESLADFSGIRILGFMAACGYIRTRLNMTSLDGALDRLLDEFTKSPEDPLNLEEYRQSLQGITASRGKAMRRLVYDTFLRFFTGTPMKLEWSDTLRQITGGT